MPSGPDTPMNTTGPVIDEAGSRDYGRLDSTVFRHERLRSVAVVVVGAGALGNEVIKNLALLGVGRVTVIDRDTVEPSNLTRSVLFCGRDIADHLNRRTPKADLVVARVRDINPEVTARAVVGEVADAGLGLFRSADVVIACVDNEMARLETSWLCLRANRPLVDGGLGLQNYSSGQVTLFPGAAGPCYLCRKGTQRRRELLQEMEGREDPCWVKAASERQRGIVVTTPLMASAIAALQVEIALRSLVEPPDSTRAMSWRLQLHPVPSLESGYFGPSPTCPLHDGAAVVTDVRTLDDRLDTCTPAMLMDAAGLADPMLRFDWPLTVEASCRDCATLWQPFVRRARFRHARCPACGGRHLVERHAVTSIRRDSQLAEQSFAALGQSPESVFQVVGGNGDIVHFVLPRQDVSPSPDTARPC